MKKQFLTVILVTLVIVCGLGWYAYTQVYTVTKSIDNTINLSQYESTFEVQQVLVGKTDVAKPNTSAFKARDFVHGNDGQALVELDEVQGKKNDKLTSVWKSGNAYYSRIEDDEAQQYIGTSLKGQYYKLDDSQKYIGTNFFERFDAVNFVKRIKDASYNLDKLSPYFGKKTYHFNFDNQDNFQKLFLSDGVQMPEYNKDKTDFYINFEKGLVKSVNVYLNLPQKNNVDYSENISVYTYNLFPKNDVKVDLPPDYQNLKTLNELVADKTTKK
jgi:hypothetical protein